jgi:hypothetical protein
MTQNKWQYFIVSAAIPVALLCSCDKHDRPLPQGAYRVSVEEISSGPTSITRRYEIETSSRRTLALAEMAGSNSASIAPDMMTEERTGKAHVTVTVALQEEGETTHVMVKMTVETRGGTARWEETLPVPPDADLASVLTEAQPTGDITEKTTLLRVTSGNKYLEVVIQ